MCGIAGFTRLGPTTRKLLPFLAYEMVARGDDSWGITNGTQTHRAVGPIIDNFEIPEFLQDGDTVVLHTRAASVGEVSVENQHPFEIVGPSSTVLGVHNGAISNHRDLSEKWKCSYPVDSQYAYHALAHNFDTRDISGWGALVWWQWPSKKPSAKRLCFLRFNMTNLSIVKDLDTGELIFASTNAALEKACLMAGIVISKEYDIKAETIYYYNPPEKPFGAVEHPLLVGPKQVFGYRSAPVRSARPGSADYDWMDTEADFWWGHGHGRSAPSSSAPSLLSSGGVAVPSLTDFSKWRLAPGVATNRLPSGRPLPVGQPVIQWDWGTLSEAYGLPEDRIISISSPQGNTGVLCCTFNSGRKILINTSNTRYCEVDPPMATRWRGQTFTPHAEVLGCKVVTKEEKSKSSGSGCSGAANYFADLPAQQFECLDLTSIGAYTYRSGICPICRNTTVMRTSCAKRVICDNCVTKINTWLFCSDKEILVYGTEKINDYRWLVPSSKRDSWETSECRPRPNEVSSSGVPADSTVS
jgi:hypothetical protein